jgi:hypothetical protein
MAKKKLEHFEIEELREPIQKLYCKLRKHIYNGRYYLIIGDDASGRIPALVFYHIIKAAHLRNGHNIPRIIFFAGKNEEGELGGKKLRAITKYIQQTIWGIQKTRRTSKRVLIVTDTIHTGISLSAITNALKENSLRFEIATIGLCGMKPIYYLNNMLGGKILFGSIGTPSIYSKPSLSGVTKSSSDTFSCRLYTKRAYEARKDVVLLAQEFS